MKPFIPTKLEAHMIRAHGTSAKQISDVRDRHPVDHGAIAQRSHELAHSMGLLTEEHTHDES